MRVHTTFLVLLRFQLLLATSLLVSACNPLEGASDNRGTANYGLVGLELKADHKILKAGDVLRVTFRVENGYKKEVQVFESKDTPVLNIFIESGPTWSVENPDKMQHRLELKPGEGVESDLTWAVPNDQSLVRRSLSVVGRP